MRQIDRTTWKHYSYTVTLENPVETTGINAYSPTPHYVVRDKAGNVISEAYNLTMAKQDIKLDISAKQQKRIEQ